MVQWINESLGGKPADMVAPRDWARLLFDHCQQDACNPLSRFLSLFEDDSGHDNRELTADTTNANAAVFDTDAMPCPRITHDIVAKYVLFFVERGLVHPHPE